MTTAYSDAVKGAPCGVVTGTQSDKEYQGEAMGMDRIEVCVEKDLYVRVGQTPGGRSERRHFSVRERRIGHTCLQHQGLGYPKGMEHEQTCQKLPGLVQSEVAKHICLHHSRRF